MRFIEIKKESGAKKLRKTGGKEGMVALKMRR